MHTRNLEIPLFYVQNMRFQYTVFLPVGMGTSIVSFLFVLHSGSTLYPSSQSSLAHRLNHLDILQCTHIVPYRPCYILRPNSSPTGS